MDKLTAILTAWITANFGLPIPSEEPDVIFASETKMMEVRLASVVRADPSDFAVGTGPGNTGLHALYNDDTGAIYLPEHFSAASPADVSVLVHELVHHIQNEAGLTYACPGLRERLAYRVQALWLEGFGTNLEEAFGLDPMTVLVRTKCWD